jgi:dTDP-4-amino-4,6-dideoxygalactose transaminase
MPRDRKNSLGLVLKEVVEGGVFVGGKYVEQFEEVWAKKVGANFAIGVSNGLDGLTLALESLNLPPRSKVAVPCHTFIATWIAIVRAGLVPVGIEVDSEGLIDLDYLEKKCGEFQAVLPVHMHGSMVNMKILKEICDSNGLRIVEDASQSHLAIDSELSAGVTGDVGVFSLYPTKNLGALGDAGIVVTNNSKLNAKLRQLRNYGASSKDKYHHLNLGYNNRLDSLQAAALSFNLSFLSQDNEKRVSIATKYEKELCNENIKPLQAVYTGRVFHHYCILTENRDDLRKFLLKNNIETEIHYPKLASLEMANILKTPIEKFPIGEKISKQTLSLPISPWHTLKQIEYVIRKIKDFNKGHGV